MTTSDDDTLLPSFLPNICQKKVTAAFDGRLLGFNGDVWLLEGADKQLSLIDALAVIKPDHRDPGINHTPSDIRAKRTAAQSELCGFAKI